MPSTLNTRPLRIPPSAGHTPTLRPAKDLKYPWRFKLGEWVHIRGFGGLTVRIESGFLHRGTMPHYRVRSTIGDHWTIPQIHISSTAI